MLRATGSTAALVVIYYLLPLAVGLIGLVAIAISGLGLLVERLCRRIVGGDLRQLLDHRVVGLVLEAHGTLHEPLVFGPALAMDNKPGLSCFFVKFSSANFLP